LDSVAELLFKRFRFRARSNRARPPQLSILRRELWLRQHLDRHRINISETVPDRARFLFKLRHRPRFVASVSTHAAFARENEPFSAGRKSRTVFPRRSIDRGHRQRCTPFSVLIVA